MRQNRRQDILDQAHEIGVKIIMAQNETYQNRVAIHLLNPDLDDIEEALYLAQRDMFPAIVIHSEMTWPVAILKGDV